MQPPWLHGFSAVSQTDDATLLGVAVCVSDMDVPLIHAGIVHRSAGRPLRLLHLAFHAKVIDEGMPSEGLEYYWTPLRMDPDRAETFAAFCRHLARRRPRIPYGVLYRGDTLSDEGTVLLSGGAVGLTCATFVLAVLKWAGFELLDLGSWIHRPEDTDWHAHIVEMLSRFRERNPELISHQHIEAVRSEKGCARFRPEEVAAACTSAWPARTAPRSTGHPCSPSPTRS